MIKLNRSELISIGNVFVLANTPYSLFSELNANLTVEKIKNQQTINELSKYYDYITDRSKRSEIAMGLAYAVLIALIKKNRDEGNLTFEFDSDRLEWGQTIQEYFYTAGRNTQVISINVEQKPSIILSH